MPLAHTVATRLTTPDTSRSLSVFAGGRDLSNLGGLLKSLVVEDQAGGAQGTIRFRVNAAVADLPEVTDQALVLIEDHTAGSTMARGFVISRKPVAVPAWDTTEIIAADQSDLLENVVPREYRPPESMQARIGYLWGYFAGPDLARDLGSVASIGGTLPETTLENLTLRQAIDLTVAQASSAADWHLDQLGRLHVYEPPESNPAPKDIDTDAPGAGKIAPLDLSIDRDSSAYRCAVYVRGKTAAGSGWVFSHDAREAHGGRFRTTFLDAPDCETEAMRNALGNMYLGRVGASAIARGSFSDQSTHGWRAGQVVEVTSAALGLSAQPFRIARVTSRFLGPASNRRYAVEFGAARAGRAVAGAATGSSVSSAINGDMLDADGNLVVGANQAEGLSGFGPALRRYITSYVYNGDFALTPPSQVTPIGTDNPLPFWAYAVASGSASRANLIYDPESASGFVCRLSLAAGAAGDDAYIEQRVPINAARGSNWAFLPVVNVRTSGTVNDMEVYVSAQYLRRDGATTTGTSDLDARTLSSIGAWTTAELKSPLANTTGAVPVDAYWLRMRIGLRRGSAATSATGEIAVCEAGLHPAPSALRVVEATSPTTYGHAVLYESNGVTYLRGNWEKPTGHDVWLALVGSSGSLELVTANDSGVTLARSDSGQYPYLELAERTVPSAPSSNRGRLFVRDNGSGKTQLCVLFPTGAVQVLATEP